MMERECLCGAILPSIKTKRKSDMDIIEESKEVQRGHGSGWCKAVGQGIMMVYFIVITVIYPYYAPGGYVRIGEVKYTFFRNVTLVTVAAMFLVITASLLTDRRVGRLVRQYRDMSLTDWFAYGYFIVIMLSYLCSPYKADALWGAEGWYMGAAMQMMFILLYFFISRFFPCSYKRLGIWLAASGGVFLLGILNRYSIYPIVMEGQTETFISTLGNINWFCGYWSVTAPLGMTLYWCSGHMLSRAVAGIFSIIAVLAGITQGSSSAYLVYMTVFAVLLMFSVSSNQRLYRFLELCMIFAAGCQIGRMMRYLPGLHYNYGNDSYLTGSRISDLLLDGNAAVWLLTGALLCYGFLRAAERYGGFQMEDHRWDKRIITAVMILLMVVLPAVFLRSSGVVRCGSNIDEASVYGGADILFQEDWGNGRGTAWNCGISAYRSMDAVHKIVGIGPDCFADYVYEVPALAEQLIDRFGSQRLTNAHNEWLTILVNMGGLGLFCYGGLFVVSVVRYGKRAKAQPLLYVCLISLLAYTIHNMVSFQQILNTPYIFIVLGMGEGLVRGFSVKSEC